MHLLQEADIATVSGGDKLNLEPDPTPHSGRPVPIWHPIFVADP